MDDGIAAFEGWLERGRVGEIADDRFAANALKVGEIAGFAGEKAQAGAFGGKGFRHMMADKTCCAGEEDSHSRVPGRPSF